MSSQDARPARARSARAPFNEILFAIPDEHEPTEHLFGRLNDKSIELIVDARREKTGGDELHRLCAEHDIYYLQGVRATDEGPVGDPPLLDASHIADLALRHRTCLFADARTLSEFAGAVAAVRELKVIDIPWASE